MANTTKSNKNKGRLGQKEVQEFLLKHFPELEPDDCRSTPMGSQGEDILLSPRARKLFPFQIEVKRQKKIAIYSFMEQAITHGKHEPVVFLREDRGEWCVLLKADAFMELLHEKNSTNT